MADVLFAAYNNISINEKLKQTKTLGANNP